MTNLSDAQIAFLALTAFFTALGLVWCAIRDAVDGHGANIPE